MQQEESNHNQSDQKLQPLWPGLVIALVPLTLSMSVLLLAPAPWKQWGGFIALTIISVLLYIRAMQTMLPRVNERPFLPPVVALFLILLAGLVFASGTLQVIAGILYGIVIGFIGICWFVWAFVSTYKETFSKR